MGFGWCSRRIAWRVIDLELRSAGQPWQVNGAVKVQGRGVKKENNAWLVHFAGPIRRREEGNGIGPGAVKTSWAAVYWLECTLVWPLGLLGLMLLLGQV